VAGSGGFFGYLMYCTLSPTLSSARLYDKIGEVETPLEVKRNFLGFDRRDSNDYPRRAAV
jgi:hypothetical protein